MFRMFSVQTVGVQNGTQNADNSVYDSSRFHIKGGTRARNVGTLHYTPHLLCGMRDLGRGSGAQCAKARARRPPAYLLAGPSVYVSERRSAFIFRFNCILETEGITVFQNVGDHPATLRHIQNTEILNSTSVKSRKLVIGSVPTAVCTSNLKHLCVVLRCSVSGMMALHSWSNSWTREFMSQHNRESSPALRKPAVRPSSRAVRWRLHSTYTRSVLRVSFNLPEELRDFCHGFLGGGGGGLHICHSIHSDSG
jgi:hypothetical protein